jgi:glycosyltransferase involved in cell wall biosynthesis
MRILHLIDSSGVYGAERVLLYLAREQQRQGHQPVLGSITRPDARQPLIEVLAATWGIPVQPIRIAPRPSPAVIRTLLGTITALQADVVHSHGYKANILLGPLPRRRRGPMLATLHGWTGGRPFSAMWMYERIERWAALPRIESLVVVTRGMLNLAALSRVDPARRHVIENGIPSRERRLADLAALKVADLPSAVSGFIQRRPTLVAIGRLAPEKGFAILIEAFARSLGGGAGAHQLLIIGDGPQRAALDARIAALGLTERIRLAGYVEGADRALADAAGFVMSSLTEGMPLVVLEAMQWDVPVIATSVGAIPQLLDQGRRGRLVAPGNAAALADALKEWASAGVKPRGGVELAAAAVSDHYTSARMEREYSAAYGAIA